MRQAETIAGMAPRWRAYLALVIMLLALGLGGIMIVRAEAERLRENAEAANFRLAAAGAHATTQGLRRTLEAATSMHELASSLLLSHAEVGSPERHLVETMLTQVAREQRFGILQVALTDAEGWLRWSTEPNFNVMDLSDRQHIRVHREGGRMPFVSAPLIGRASMRWSVQVSTPVLDGAGKLIGISVVSLDPLALSEGMGELRFTEGITAYLLRRDGLILARSQNPGGFLGTMRGGPDQPVMNAQMEGQLLTHAPTSGRRVFLAWRHLAGWPVLATFAIDATLAMQDVRRQQKDLYTFLGIFLLASAITGLLIIELWTRGRVRIALRQAEASREQMSRLIDALPGAPYRGYATAGGELVEQHLSPAIARITGWPEDKLETPAAYTAIITGEFQALRRRFFQGLPRTGRDAIEYSVTDAAGNTVWLRDECRAVGTRPDGSIEVVGLISDITAERGIMAQAISTAKLATLGEMATGVAHELNQPCAAIALAADIAALELQRGGADHLAAAQKRLDGIARQTMRMRGIIDHFRIFGRTDDGEETSVDLAEVLQGALIVAGGTLRASGVRVESDVPSALPPVRGSLVALEQVLVNLMVNARDAMEATPEAQRRIEVRAHAEAQEVVLILRDHGSGIAEAAKLKLFEPFYTTKPLGKGTGLGLSIAYGTIRGFGGSIAIRNHAQGGAEAEIRLPLASSMVQAEAA